MDRNFKVFIIFFFLQRFNAKLTSDGTFFVKNGKIDTQHWSAEDSRGFIVADNEFHLCSRRIECDELRKTTIEPHSDAKWKKTQEINPSEKCDLSFLSKNFRECIRFLRSLFQQI